MTFCITEHNSTLFGYKNHLYKIYKPKQFKHDHQQLKQAFSMCESMLWQYSKVIIIRVDLHPAEYSADNNQINQFLSKQQSALAKQYHCEVQFMYAREQHTSDRQHYHVALLLSGHKINHSAKLIHQISQDYKSSYNGSVHSVKRPFCMMHRGDKSTINPALYRISYLFKQETKQLNPKRMSYRFSKIQLPTSIAPNDDVLLVDPDITFEQQQRKLNYARLTLPKQPSKTLQQLINQGIQKRRWFDFTQNCANEVVTTTAAYHNSISRSAPQGDPYDHYPMNRNMDQH